MEQINQAIQTELQKVEGTNTTIQCTNSYEWDKRNLTNSEAQVLEVKYKSKQIGKMSNEEISLSAKSVLMKICVIVGWKLPEQTFLNILVDQMGSLLTEKYRNVNIHEIEYAFRNYPMEDWGKDVNLHSIQKVMQPYLAFREMVSSFESHKKKPMELPPSKETDIEAMEYVLNFFKREDVQLEMIPVYVYDDAERLGIISLTKEEKNKIFERAKAKKRSEIEVGLMTESIKYRELSILFNEQEKLGKFSGSILESIKNTAKKIAVMEHMNKLKGSADK